MPRPQSGVLPPANRHAVFLTLLLNAGQDAGRQTRRILARIPQILEEVVASDTQAGLSCVVAIGAEAWDRLWPNGPRPTMLRRFPLVQDGARAAPRTSADLFIHVRSERADLNFDLIRSLRKAFSCCVTTAEEVHTFRYHDMRDLTGFVDGTENPEGQERVETALVGLEDAGHAGGSYVHVQRYVHDLDAWERLSVDEQERVFGRTKADDVEMAAGVKPATAHIKRVSIKDNGEELKILRHSMPYGTGAEAGLYFVSYAKTPEHFERMLIRMIHADEAGNYDHLMHYTRAVTGAAFFAPSLDFLLES
ncbi:MAG: Dyp-type peroxidase [Chromatiales bacterium]|nr:Dyp-type peroxidase [Chromatiales bacterium]